MVLSSRFYWEAYIGQRRSILQDVLVNKLGTSVFLDALSVVNARRIGTSTLLGADRLDETRRVQVREEWLSNTDVFLRHYRENSSNTPQRIELEYLEEMSRLLGSVQVVAREFFKATLSKHPLTGQELGFRFEDLSKTELQRIYGAIIRLEICCALWGDRARTGDELEAASDDGLDVMVSLANLFLSKLRPWEFEELACIRDFLFRFYDQVYMDAEAEFAVCLHPKLWMYGFLPVERRSEWRKILPGKSVYEYNYLSEIFMSCGVELHAKIIRCGGGGPGMARKKVRYLKERGKLADRLEDIFLTEQLRNYWNLDHDQEDSGPILTGENSPNVAWVRYVAQHTGLRHQDPYNRPTLGHSRVHLRLWGFVMWDQARLEKLEVMKEMDRSNILTDPPLLWDALFHRDTSRHKSILG